jgi:hypothetical protein
MPTSRRQFLTVGTAATLGSFLSTSLLVANARNVTLPTSPTEEKLLHFVRGYSSQLQLVGVGILEKLRFGASKHVHLLVGVDDLAEFQAALPLIPFSGVYAVGSKVQFEAEGIQCTVESVPDRTFAERRVLLTKARYLSFAHDALAYDPLRNVLADPFGAAKGETLRLINRTHSGVPGLATLMRGLTEAGQLGLKLSSDFSRWQARILRLFTRTKDVAAAMAVLLSHLPELADVIQPEQLKAILRSPLVKSALADGFGVNVELIISAYDAWRAAHAGSVANASIWIASLLQRQIAEESTTGVLTPLLQAGSRFQVLRGRQALSQARQLLAA